MEQDGVHSGPIAQNQIAYQSSSAGKLVDWVPFPGWSASKTTDALQNALLGNRAAFHRIRKQEREHGTTTGARSRLR